MYFFLLYNIFFSGFVKHSSLKLRWCQKFKDHIMAPAGHSRIEIQEGVLHRKVQYLTVHFLHFKVRLNVTSDLVRAPLLEESGSIWLPSHQQLGWGSKGVTRVTNSNQGDRSCFWKSGCLWKPTIASILGQCKRILKLTSLMWPSFFPSLMTLTTGRGAQNCILEGDVHLGKLRILWFSKTGQDCWFLGQ